MNAAADRIPLGLSSGFARVETEVQHLRRGARTGDLVRVRAGVYAHTSELGAATGDQRYRAGIDAVAITRRRDAVFSRQSAALLHGIPIVRRWPDGVHLTEPVDPARRTKRGVVVHREGVSTDDVVEIDGLLATSAMRTVVDVARTAPAVDAVAALDHVRNRALRAGRPVSPESLLDALATGPQRGAARAARLIRFSVEVVTRPLESLSRVRIHELGFPAPELQRKFVMPSGRRFGDFWWERERVLGESDGQIKYSDPETAAAVIWDEKVREMEFSDLDVRLARWGWSDALVSERLAVRLRAAGLRQRRPMRLG